MWQAVGVDTPLSLTTGVASQPIAQASMHTEDMTWWVLAKSSGSRHLPSRVATSDAPAVLVPCAAMGVIVEWFIADNDDQAATAVQGWDELHRFPTARVGLAVTYAWVSLEAILTGQPVEEVKAGPGHEFVVQLGDGEVSVLRLSPNLVRSVGEVADDAIAIVARSWAVASGDEPDEEEATLILQQVVPMFRQANEEGLVGYEFSCV